MEPISGSLIYGQVERELNERYTTFEESAKGLMEFARDFFQSRFMSVRSNYLDCSVPGKARNLTNEEVSKWSNILFNVRATNPSAGCVEFKVLVNDVHYKALQVLEKIKETMPHNQDFAKVSRTHYEHMMNDFYKEAQQLAMNIKMRQGIYDNTDFGNSNLVPIYTAEALRFLKAMQKLRCLPYR